MTLHSFPIVFPVELGCFHLFYPVAKLLKKIFARNLHMLLKIDYISTCVIYFKCTLLLENIISWHVGEWGDGFLWPTLYCSKNKLLSCCSILFSIISLRVCDCSNWQRNSLFRFAWTWISNGHLVIIVKSSCLAGSIAASIAHGRAHSDHTSRLQLDHTQYASPPSIGLQPPSVSWRPNVFLVNSAPIIWA